MATDFELLERLAQDVHMGVYVDRESATLRHPQGGTVARVQGGHVIVLASSSSDDEVIHAHHWTLAVARTRWNTYKKAGEAGQERRELIAIERAANMLYDLGVTSDKKEKDGYRLGVSFSATVVILANKIPQPAIRVMFFVKPENLQAVLDRVKGLVLDRSNQESSNNGP